MNVHVHCNYAIKVIVERGFPTVQKGLHKNMGYGYQNCPKYVDTSKFLLKENGKQRREGFTSVDFMLI